MVLMKYIQILISCYKNLFDLRGRASRLEYWCLHLFVVLLIIIGLSILSEINDFDSLIYYSFSESIYDVVSYILAGIPYLLMGVGIISIIAIISVTVRRFHDLGKSVFMYFAFVLPYLIAQMLKNTAPQIAAVLYIGTTVFYFIYISQKSEQKINKFGPVPKK